MSLKWRSDISDFNAVITSPYQILVSLGLCAYRDVGRVVNVSRSAVQTIHNNWVATIKQVFFRLALLFHGGAT